VAKIRNAYFQIFFTQNKINALLPVFRYDQCLVTKSRLNFNIKEVQKLIIFDEKSHEGFFQIEEKPETNKATTKRK
jgi:hypothetical protein